MRRFTNWRTCLSSLGAVFESRWHLGYVASTVFLCRRNRSRKTAPRVDGRLTPIVPVTSVSSAFVFLHTVQSRAVSKPLTLRQTLWRVKRTFERIAKLTPTIEKCLQRRRCECIRTVSCRFEVLSILGFSVFRGATRAHEHTSRGAHEQLAPLGRYEKQAEPEEREREREIEGRLPEIRRKRTRSRRM